MKIGDQIRAIRIKEGWSRRRLAKEAGVSVTHITKIEAGLIDPRASTLKKIAKAADIIIVISIE